MSKKFPAWIPPFVIVTILICLYGITASTRLTWANSGYDGGDFLAAILTGGIPHPTGYPTYLILGRLFQWVPVGDAYFRAVLLSFLPAAIAAALFGFWVNYVASDSVLPGLIAGLIWGMSPLLWSQSVIVEVYGLQALFTVLALWWITLLFRSDRNHTRLLIILALVFGAGIGNHVTIFFFLPIIIAGWVYWVRQTRRIKFGLLQIGAFILGGLVYIYLPIQAIKFPAVNWGNPQTMTGFLWEVTGRPYQSLWGNIPINNVIDRWLASATILGQQVGFIGLILGIIGSFHIYQSNRKISRVCFYTFFSYLIFAIGYNTADSTAYLIPAIMIFCGWIGFSLNAFTNITWKRISIAPAVALVVLIVLIIQTPQTMQSIDPQKGVSAAEYAEFALKQFPQDAIILTSTDVDSFPLWAYHFGYGFREDLSIIVLPLTQFEWYQQTLVHTYPTLQFPGASTTNTTNWGAQIGRLNENHILCQGVVKNMNKVDINFTCSNGKVIAFPGDQ
jgi:hypothetical protein